MAKETFGGRLSGLLESKRVSQVQLAEHLEVTRAAVSGWCRDEKKPSPARRAQIAERLGVPEEYLEFGIGPGLAAVDLDQARNAYRSEVDWYFQRPPKDGQRTLGNPAEFAFEVGIPVFVRESGQNSNDERIPTEQTVEMIYTVMELSGQRLAAFLDALRFEEQLRPHLEAASVADQKAARVLKRGIEALDEQRSLLLIKVDDYNAHGLTGPEFDRGRYMAVVRNTLDSFKSGTSAGGSYGLGKAALWACSQFGLVLMNSTLYEEQDERWRNRFVGRLELPWHQCEGDSEGFSGPAWMGQLNDNEVAESYWDNPALLRDLHLERLDDRPGTSFLIVGAYDPSGESMTPDAIEQSISRSVARNFWPAMVERGPDTPPRLRVSVRRLKNGELVSESLVDPTLHEGSKVRALTRYYEGATVETMEDPGDVVALTVPLVVESRLDDGDGHPKLMQEAVALVAHAEEGEPGTDMISYLRGSFMVVESYVLRGLPLGARDFHAIVLAGEAVGASEQDRQAERFLRAAEPPEHNKWTGTSEVTQMYARGARQRLLDFRSGVETAVRRTIARPPRDLSDGPRALKELLRVGAGRREKTPTPRVKSASGGPDAETGAWIVREAVLALPERRTEWKLKLVIRFGAASGSGEPVAWSNVQGLKNCRYDEDEAILVVAAGARTAKFSGRTNAETHPVGARYAKVELDIRVEGGQVR